MLLPKIRITSKKLQIKVFGIEFLIKNSTSAYVDHNPTPLSGARGLERLVWLKYYFVLKRQITFNLGLNADKYTDNKRKGSKKMFRIQFPTKNSVSAYLSPPGVELGGSSSYSNRTFDEISMPNAYSSRPPLL